MKFPKIQHERVLEIISSSPINDEEFYFVKRKGWIRIEHLTSGRYFTYFKKKETKINPVTKNWENMIFFKVRNETKKDWNIPDFDSVLVLFEKWLKDLTP